MSDSKHIPVTGATGQQGGSVVRALLARRHKVRALTRNADSPTAKALAEQDVEVVVGEFTDHDSLVNAFTGVDGVFAVSTPFEQGVDGETAQGIALVDAAKTAGVGHFVYTSVGSADRNTGIPHFDSKYKVEEYLAASGLKYTIIAPVFFMENVLAPWVLPGLKDGKFSQAMPGTRSLQQIAVADIGQFAAAIFERGEAVFGKRYDIAGDEISGDEEAAVLSKVTGKDIRYVGFPPDAMREQNEDMALMYEWFDDVGYSIDFDALCREFPEVAWHDFETWAREQDWSVLDMN